ncbi:pyridoxal phosphate-dependent decarboxylase family protein [Streptacidiphilus jiangxiensis]|uniref:Glutamate or tyrosine decarboxylase n=1 Tax=Streptacidiphilus jiangxiensis TaxID=235985 RepID=A0A1H7TTU4_STRJI|nr:aminotransferase class I/II-fold pyridoxal phosphate-dependent enzyme [Streptacidiphilus jiangxiensis]SEL88270.1 Glutamate or tyrosine decarboxylase [Streptacidiphilus jiangxiensis]
MHTYDAALAQVVIGHVQHRLALDPVPLGGPGDPVELDAALKEAIGARPSAADQVIRLYADHIEPTVISCDSPRFLSFIPGAPTKAAALFDMVLAASSLHGVSWLEASGAVAAENQVLRLLADLAGMPGQAGGCFVSGGSAGNLSGLVVARDTARTASGDRIANPRIAVSSQAHSSISSTLRIIGVEALVVPVEDHRLTADALRAALAADPHPETVVAVVATAGTTNAGIIDDLSGIAEVAREQGLWFHVDAAYGGGALFSAELRSKFAGIEQADSVVMDPHKWMYTPFDCGALLYRNPALAAAVHTQDAGYLDCLHTEAPQEWNPSDYAYHLTRRPRGLPLWFSLAVNGTDAYRDAVDATRRTALQAAELVRAAEHLELLREPDLSVVLLRRTGWSHDDYYAWSKELLERQIAFVTPTVWEGETVARLAFLHPDITLGAVHEILATMAEPRG